MPRVTSTPDADTVILRWGEDGTPHVVREGDEEAGGIAFIKCVAEGLARGDLIEDEVELLVAKALLEDAAFVTFFPTTGDVSTTKAGRVLSGSNLSALQAIHDAVGAVISAEMTRRQEKPGDNPDDAEPDDETLKYIVTKADGEQMYTFGPLYAPDRKDAHGEYTDSDTLTKAVHAYVQSCVDQGDNRLNIQHSDDKAAGRWVEVCAWPYETTVKMKVPGESSREVTLPAGTIYMGIQWEPNVWPDVKKGRLTGLSLGGRAMRVVSDDNPAPMGKAMGAVCDQFSPSEDDPNMCANCGMSQDAHDSGDPS